MPVSATVLGNLQVIIVGLVAWLLLGERPSRATMLALPIVLVGVVLISGVVGDGAYGSNPQLGVILGLLTAVCYAAYLLTIRRGGRDARRPAGPVAIATGIVVICSFVIGRVVGDLDLTPGPPSIFWLVMLGVTAQSAGYLLISISLPRLPAIITSVILLCQPVMSMGLAMVLLGETPSSTPAAWCGVRRRRDHGCDDTGGSDARRPPTAAVAFDRLTGGAAHAHPGGPRQVHSAARPARRVSVASTTCACWSARGIVAGGSLG